MKTLNYNWLTEGLIDFEYKKYILLAYLKANMPLFDDMKLYPFLSDLIFHYENLKKIKEQKKLIYQNFPEKVTKAEFEKLKISYEKIVKDDDFMEELEAIVEFGLSELRKSLDKGKTLYEDIESKMAINPVGLMPIYKKEGYMLMSVDDDAELKVYRYMVTFFEKADEKFQGLNTVFVESVNKSPFETYENLKIGLVRRYKELPNPATYLISAREQVPFEESLMPIAKRMLVREIFREAA